MAAAQFFSIFQIYQYFLLYFVQSQFKAALIQILGLKSQIGEDVELEESCSYESQQLAEREYAWAWQATR